MDRTKIRKLYINLTAPITFCKFAKRAISVADAESYYPEMQRKSRAKRITENLSWLAKYKEVNDFYNLYGFDIENFRNQDDYIDNYSFYLSRGDANRTNSPESQTCILRDKLLFYEFMKFNGFPTPEVIALIEAGEVYDLQHNYLGDEFLKKKTNYFIKERNGECASFVRHISAYEDYLVLKPQLSGAYIVQLAIEQRIELRDLNPESINTIRLVTVKPNRGGNIGLVVSALLRVGTQKSEKADNWAAGGVAVGIDEGKLRQYGFFKPCHGLKVEQHPDTEVVFKGYQLPDYQKAVEIALKAHACLEKVHSIGWDIALTSEGPVFIEGNDNWEISLMQACNGPLRKEWNRIL